jgi:uncharacterized LabA/DUF88 family protein
LTRVAVFVDYQNTFHGARGVFQLGHDRAGQIHPWKLGELLTDRGRRIDDGRRLTTVKTFRGEPVRSHSRVGQAAAHRQAGAWAATGVQPVTRPLRYRRIGVDARGAPVFEVREKGIDVLIAIHMTLGAVRDEYDVAILMSADSDLAPAVETVRDLGKRCEVAGWRSRARPRIAVPGVWCHWLDRSDYEHVADPTDYTRPG